MDLGLLPQHMRLWAYAREPESSMRVVRFDDPAIPRRMRVPSSPQYSGLRRCAAATARLLGANPVFCRCRRPADKSSVFCAWHRWLLRQPPSAVLDHDLAGWR